MCIFIATEIRCQEKSKGGLCYEVILGHPAITAPLRQNKTSPTKNLTAEEIERKLREAEERRLVGYFETKWTYFAIF